MVQTPELTDLCERLKDDFYNVRVVLLYGGDEGKGFCAGLGRSRRRRRRCPPERSRAGESGSTT